MVNISKESSSFIIQGDVNSYPFKDGKISLPLNSLYFVIDESNVISFKQVNDNNTLLSVNINNLQINGEQVTKENLIEKFDAVANGSMGGTKINAGTNITLQPEADGSITISATGELGGTVAWQDVTDKPETFTPSAHNHVVADITDLQGKLNEKANVSDIPSLDGYATEEWVNSQGYLTEHQDISQLATKAELATKQDKLVSGTNIKTVNGNSLLGEGNIEIQGGGSGISDAPSDDKLYGRKNANWSEIIIPSTDNFATKSEIADMLTKTEAASTYQPKGEYATISQLDAKLDTETYNSDKATFATKEELASKANTSDLSNYVTTVNAEATYAKKSEIPSLEGYLQTSTADEKYQPKGEYLTSVPDEYITESELDAKGYKKIEYLTQTQYDELPTKEEGVLYVITDAPEVVIPDTSDMLTKTEASSTYQPKGEYATTSQLASKQDKLVSGESIKTINGESILGSGNITIEGGAPGQRYIQNLNTVNADNIFGFYSIDNSGDGARYPYKLTSRNGIKISKDSDNAAFIESDTEVLLTKTEASTTYALQTALQAALDRIATLEAQVGNISTQLDNINGEIV